MEAGGFFLLHHEKTSAIARMMQLQSRSSERRTILMKRRLSRLPVVWGCAVLLACIPAVSTAYVAEVVIDENRYLSNGRINNNFSYQHLHIQAAEGGCLFSGTITNTSSVLQAVDITVQAVDASEQELWRHTLSLPAVSAGDSYQFEETVDDCSETVPYRLKFEVSQ
jgi:hypothetical protein